MSKVVEFPTTLTTPAQALTRVEGLNLQDVLIIGYDQEGCLVIQSSKMSLKEALWLVKAAERYVYECNRDRWA